VHLVGLIKEEFEESDVMLKVALYTSTDAKNYFMPTAGTCVICHMSNTHADNATSRCGVYSTAQ